MRRGQPGSRSLGRYWAALAAGLGFASTVVSASWAGDVVVHAGHLIDAVGKAPRANVSILIHDDRIVSVTSGFTAPAGAVVVDLEQATVLPGLIDAHVHLTDPSVPGDPVAWSARHSPLDEVLLAVPAAEKTLAAGFTSVRNVAAHGGTDLALKHAVEEGSIHGPRMWVSLEPLGPTGGHSDAQNGLKSDLTDPDWRNAVVDGADEVRKQVRLHHRRGADLIKIMPSGGVLSEGDDPAVQLMTDEEIKAAIDTAHNLGMKVAAHAHGKAAIDTAARLGIDSIEHGSYADAESFRLMKAHGVYLVPTLLVAEAATEAARTHPERMRPSTAAKALEVSPHTLANLGLAYRTGVKIAFGTDTGGGPTPPGRNGHEFVLMVRAGMTPIDAIWAATANAADLLGATDRIGSVQPGRYADLIAVSGDPLADISELERVKFVMQGGIVFKNSLSKK
jgi:imidazolonepropionase-like amidohydrolase